MEIGFIEDIKKEILQQVVWVGLIIIYLVIIIVKSK